MDERVAADSSYRIGFGNDDDVISISEVEVPSAVEHEPETSGWQRFVADLVKLFPIQSQL